MAVVRLRRGQDARVAAGHPWVYRGNIERIEGGFEPGDAVDVVNAARHFLGRGYINPRSEIVVRLLTRKEEAIDEAFFARRIADAVARRRRFFPEESSYRVVFGEGDFLPGLVVDKYEDVLAVQTLTLGMEVRWPLIQQALQEILAPAAIYERNEAPAREREGLARRKGPRSGTWEPQREIRENGLRFVVDLERGQKTGYFFDQKENRRALAPLVPGARVLDAFSHTGSFAVHAAAYGAESVLGLEISPDAVAAADLNAARNGFADVCRFETANAFDALRELAAAGESFDCAILDPPAFARSKDALAGARRGYKEINLRGLKLVRPGGWLVTCTCSYPVGAADFWEIVLDAARDAHRTVRLVEERTQARDHPILPAVPETRYLKCLILEVL